MKTKQEAAQFLGVTIRSIESYAAKGKLTPAKAKGRRGDITLYDEQELEALRREREQIQYIPKPEIPTPGNNTSTALSRRFDINQFVQMIDAVRTTNPSISDIAAKPLLKLEEAQMLTGLSREILRTAINSGTLKAKIIGRAWRVKRIDLDSYLKTI